MARTHRELEESLSRIATVDAARVVTEGDRIAEVHVIAAPGKPAKQVVRDVQSLALARFGASIDRRVISVVQIAPERLHAPTPNRAALVGIREEPTGTRTTLQVTLRYDDAEQTGEATGPAVAAARLRLVGEATIDAVERTFTGLGPLALDAVTLAAAGSRRIAVAVVVGTDEQGTARVTVGSALADEDADAACVRAVLDALNRRLERGGR